MDGEIVVAALVLNSFLRTTRVGLPVGRAVDDVAGVVVEVVPERIAGRVRFLKKGTEA